MSEPEEDEGEVVDGLPVVAAPRAVEPARHVVPARHVAALAATVAVVSRRRSRLPLRRRKRKSGPLEIVGSNSFLVDVHLLRRP